MDAKWRHSNLICSTSCIKFQLNMSKHVWENCGKRADGDPDGRTESRTDWRTSPYHNTSCLKTPDGRIIKIFKCLMRTQHVAKFSNILMMSCGCICTCKPPPVFFVSLNRSKSPWEAYVTSGPKWLHVAMATQFSERDFQSGIVSLPGFPGETSLGWMSVVIICRLPSPGGRLMSSANIW